MFFQRMYTLQKGTTPLSLGFSCEAPITNHHNHRPSTPLHRYGWCVFRDSGVAVLLRLTSLSEEHNDTAKSFRQSLCSIFHGSIMLNYSHPKPPDAAPVVFRTAAEVLLMEFEFMMFSTIAHSS